MTHQTRLTAMFLVLLVSLSAGFYLLADQYKQDLRDSAARAAITARDASVAGCNRTRQDRLDAIRGWSTGRETRLATARNPDVDMGERLRAAEAATIYGEVVKGYRSRIVPCEKAFPPVRP